MGLIIVISVVFIIAYLLFPYLLLGYTFVFPDHSLLKSERELTNVLILGKGGEGHEAPDLTDTLMLVLFDRSVKKISLLPLSRDIWVPEIRAKLNSAYYWGKEKDEGYLLVDSAVKKVTNKNVHYHIVVDFSIFKNVIDALGGIEVNVENAFTDTKYPIAGKENDECGTDKSYACRYETLKFEKGIQVMDGETALKFVRSRNAEGLEGTDTARGARQQKVIEAIQKKVSSSSFYLNPKAVLKVFKEATQGIETDFDSETLAILGRVAFDSKNNVVGVNIPDEMFEVPNKSSRYDYQYVFIPVGGSYEDIHKWIENSLSR